MTEAIGVIAEDDTDYETLRVIVRRVLENDRVPVKRFVGNGHGALCKNTEKWAAQLARDGCTRIVVVHDADEFDDRRVRAKMERHQAPRGAAQWLCIPVWEIEAWFWSDPAVLSEVARRPIKAQGSPRTMKDPKEALIRISRDERNRARYSTADNPRLAAKLDLERCARACREFRDLLSFVRG